MIELNAWAYAGTMLEVLLVLVLVLALPVSLAVLALLVNQWWWGAIAGYLLLAGWWLLSTTINAVKDLPPDRVSPRWLRSWARGEE